jgi:Protein of unknown function (DUF2949)
MKTKKSTQFIHFLENDLAIPAAEIQLALRQVERTSGLLPIVLWQYGLVNTTQLSQIFDWLEQAPEH